MTDLWTTCIGSHLWSMNTPESDIDLFTAYITPTTDILNGKNRGENSHCSGSSEPRETDKVSHEIGKIINQLIKGNFNFIVGTLSPLIISQHKTDVLTELKEIVELHGQTKTCVHSIRGLAISNYKKYIVNFDATKEYSLMKKCNTVTRTLLFGINLLNGNGFMFKPVNNQTPEDVVTSLKEFDKAVLSSKLKETTNPEPFREYLFKIRMMELNGQFTL